MNNKIVQLTKTYFKLIQSTALCSREITEVRLLNEVKRAEKMMTNETEYSFCEDSEQSKSVFM